MFQAIAYVIASVAVIAAGGVVGVVGAEKFAAWLDRRDEG